MEKLFKLSEKGTNVKVELRAGLATFLTMAYIISLSRVMIEESTFSRRSVRGT